MKISTGGIGAVATSQACNAKSAYPYQWAWNAVGTDLTTLHPHGEIANGSNDTVENHQYGIKHGVREAGFANPEVLYYDEVGDPPGGNRSGSLNAVDMDRAKYAHLVVDLKSGNDTNWAFGMIDETTNNVTQITSEYGFTRNWDNREWRLERGETLLPDDWGHGVLNYNTGNEPGGVSGSVSVSGGVAMFQHSLNSNTFILVWNLKDQVHRQPVGEAGSWGTESDAPTWVPFQNPERPLIFSFYPGGRNAFGGSTNNYLIIMGWVLADRILSDIPLPIRTHMG